ncbi:MAG: hypothetical protein M1371_05405 [Actinobacteria bacterium]|nr:hypothetical protein [Actinomycetota bacterium]
MFGEENTLVNKICKGFCKYYKPEKNEELSCQGFIVAVELIKKGAETPTDKKYLTHLMLKPVTIKNIRQNLCGPCSFFENDCDFVQNIKGSPPCGGFILLGYMLEAGTITAKEIVEICKNA